VLTEEQRARTLARYEEHRRAWESNEALRTLYGTWYGRVAARLPAPALGPFVEIGSGPGFARSFIPGLRLTDVVRAPWHDEEVNADRLPFADGSLGALVLFDVLHHLAAPAAFFEQALRVLAPGGRVVMCEPYLSPLSFPVYRFLHEEPVVLGVDPLAVQAGSSQPGGENQPGGEKDPFDSNQAIPTLLFARPRGRAAFSARFPQFLLGEVERFAGPAYPASGGFGKKPLLPLALWRALNSVEPRLPEVAYRLIGFRMLVTVEKRGL
jgi:SAM-dependent methyltransferase